ncbi:MAG: hypothetical protein M1831_006382 [Alyxoria varia]|nr:MAG: hypothetical protein M1831_006382 [Alyxoria varia]
MAHPVYLFQDPGSPVETFAPERPPRWLALIHTNRQMNREASAVLYGVNNFTLVDTTQQQVGLLQAFLDCIGPVNASLLSQMCINFPVMEFQMEECKLREDDLQSLKLLQEKCTNLSILETYIHNNNSKGLTRMHEGNLQPILEALSQFDVQLKAIPSLEKVIVRVHDGAPIPSVMRSMQGLGWIVLPGTGNKW